MEIFLSKHGQDKPGPSRAPWIAGHRSVAIMALLTLSSFMFLWNLGANSISGRSDEVIYTRVVQSILHKGDLFPLTHGNSPMYEKPPLKLWLSAIPPLLFGESNWSFRIIDGLLGITCVWLTVFLGLRLGLSLLLSLASGLLLLSMPELVISQHSFRRAVLDGLLAAETLAAALLTRKFIAKAHSSQPSAKDLAAIGTMCGLAVLTKSVAGIIPALCATVSLCAYSRPRLKHWMTVIALVLGIPAVTFSLYCGALWLAGGAKALQIFLGVEIFHRAVSGFQGHNTDSRGFYLWYLFVRGATSPIALLFVGIVGTIISSLCESLRSISPSTPQTVKEETGKTAGLFLLIWALLPVAAYSFSTSKAPWYLSPFFPFLSLISTLGTAEIVRRIANVLPRQNHQSTTSAYRQILRRLAPLIFVSCLIALSLPPFARALKRNISEVCNDSARIEIDLLVESLRSNYTNFVIVGDAISGRSNPRHGRFNLEGIYREILRPNLRSVESIHELIAGPGEAIFIREDALSQAPLGWREIGRLAPSSLRDWGIVVVTYPPAQ